MMIEKVKSRALHEGKSGVELRVADGKVLPFADESFARCRIDRVLQHIPAPQQVIREASRILKPGGVLYLYDNDWSSFSLSMEETRLSRIVETYWCDAFVNGRIALHLKAYLHAAGFQVHSLLPSTLVLETFSEADRLYNITGTLARTIEAGLLSSEEAEAAADAMRKQTEEGTFMCALTSYTILAEKKDIIKY